MVAAKNNYFTASSVRQHSWEKKKKKEKGREGKISNIIKVLQLPWNLVAPSCCGCAAPGKGMPLMIDAVPKNTVQSHCYILGGGRGCQREELVIPGVAGKQDGFNNVVITV